MSSSPFTNDQISEFRDEFPHIKKGYTYINHAAIGAISIPVKKAIDRFIDERHSGPVENYEHGMEITETTRNNLARYLNAPSADQLTFIGNTSEGITAIAEGFDWKQGDQVILNTMEFPATVQPFRAVEHHGVEICYAEPRSGEITAEILEKNITPKTRMIILSSVQYLSGFRADLKSIGELCRKHNIIFVVDAIQSLGAFQIDVQECHIDALSSGSHKWLMAPLGIGFLYLSENFANKIRPFKTGWLSVKEPWELKNFNQQWQPLHQHLEIGTPNMLGITGLGASIKFLTAPGPENVSRRIEYITDYTIYKISSNSRTEILSPLDPAKRGGIISFSIEGVKEPEAVAEHLSKNNVTISCREGFFRLSPHFYNTEKDIDKAIDLLFEQL